MVEFALFLVLLVVGLMLIVQIALVGLQKWQFNHFALYQARVWSVDKKNRSQQAVGVLVYSSAYVKWRKITKYPVIVPFGHFWPHAFAAPFFNTSDTRSGPHYSGYGQAFPLFKPFFGLMRAGLFVAPKGYIPFQTFIPMQQEPKENPNRYDNDCSDPCNDNKR